MGVPTSEVGYTPAMPRREDHEVHKGHVVALDPKKIYLLWKTVYRILFIFSHFIHGFYVIITCLGIAKKQERSF